jgi:hypothetical protein
VGTKAEFPAQGLEERSPLGEVGILHLQSHRNVSFHIDGGVGVDYDSLWQGCSGSGGGVAHGCREGWRGKRSGSRRSGIRIN